MLSQYIVELWTHQPLEDAALRAAIETASSHLDGFHYEPPVTDSATAPRIIHDTAPKDGGPPPEWIIEARPMNALDRDDRTEIEQALMQSWWFPEAREIAATCQQRIILSDRLHTGLDYKRRLSDLQTITAALLQTIPCDAMWWVPAQQFLPPTAVLESFREDKFRNPLPGAINVRSYEVPNDHGSSDQAGEDAGPFRLMDTLGLYAFGLTDLQICYRGIDPEVVSQVLFNTVHYLFEHGPVLRGGETIQGPGANDLWLVSPAEALSEPHRSVWSVDPGAPFSVPLPVPGALPQQKS